MSLLAYCMNILLNLMMLSMFFVMITMSMAAVKRVAEVLDELGLYHDDEKIVGYGAGCEYAAVRMQQQASIYPTRCRGGGGGDCAL